MINLVTRHGTGDTYMTLAFARAFAQARREEVTVLIKQEHESIGRMFPDVKSSTFIGDLIAFQAHNMSEAFVEVHPTSYAGDISRFALLDRPTTHADLWRALLGLSLSEPMARGWYDHKATRLPGRVFIIDRARSWPNHHPEFWQQLTHALEQADWDVRLVSENNSLAEVFQQCSDAEWVIGPQCGVMAILCHALFPCRKTIATPSIDGTGWIVPRTYPYANVTKFAGEDYDVDEVKITGDTTVAVKQVMKRSGGLGLRVHGVTVDLTHGDFFDRLSILEIKMTQFPRMMAAGVQREYLRYKDIAEPIFARYGEPLLLNYISLKACNQKAWEHNERAVPDALNHKSMQSDHAEAIRFNYARVKYKNQINEICCSASSEIKSYYKEPT